MCPWKVVIFLSAQFVGKKAFGVLVIDFWPPRFEILLTFENWSFVHPSFSNRQRRPYQRFNASIIMQPLIIIYQNNYQFSMNCTRLRELFSSALNWSTPQTFCHIICYWRHSDAGDVSNVAWQKRWLHTLWSHRTLHGPGCMYRHTYYCTVAPLSNALPARHRMCKLTISSTISFKRRNYTISCEGNAQM